MHTALASAANPPYFGVVSPETPVKECKGAERSAMGGSDRTVRVGLIKAVPLKWELEANWRMFHGLAREAAGRGARIICTPECFLDGYVAAEEEGWSGERFLSVGQRIDDSAFLSMACDTARDLGIYIVFGFTERVDRGCYNAAALIDDTGTIRGCYRKTHLLDHDTCYLPGDDFPVWETPLATIGIMICADRWWPETARTLKVRGAGIIMNPTYGMWHLDNEWWMRTRSYENELFICFTHPNVALVTGPHGELAAKLVSNVPDVLVHDIDLSLISDVMFEHRRTDIYDL